MPFSPGQKRALQLGLLLVLLSCVACSGGSSVQGTVNYQGKGIQGAVVIFHPKGASITSQKPSGVTGEDGTFTLGAGSKISIPPGEYTVTIIWPEQKSEAKMKKGSTEPAEAISVDRLGGRYANEKTSPLKVTISSGSNKLDPIDLK